MDIVSKINGNQVSSAEFNQIPAELENLITSSGQAVSDAILNQDTIAVSRYAANNFYIDSGAANAYILSLAASMTNPVSATVGYFTGMTIRFRAGNANTGASTVNINSAGVKNLKKEDGTTNLAAGDIPTTQDSIFRYNGTAFCLVTRVQFATSTQVNTGTSTTTAITPAALAGAQTMRAHRGTSDQSGVSSGIATKVQFNIEDWDVGGYYDNVTNYRFLPNVAGYYLITVSVAINSSANFDSRVVAIYKNGAEWSSRDDATIVTNAGQTVLMSHTDVVYLNGSTDYIEGFGRTTSVGTIVFKNNNSTFFAATKLR